MGDDHRRRGRGLAVLVAIVSLLVLAPIASGSPARNDVARGIVVTLNDARAAQGLPPLANSAGLDASAYQHALSMARRGYFKHDSADGTPFWKRIQGFYPAGGYVRWSVGETLFWSRASTSAGSVIAAWLGSPEHRTILLGDWTQVGVAIIRVPVAPGVYGGRSAEIAVADFGLRSR
jgi:uncharacterized protein YkwD